MKISNKIIFPLAIILVILTLGIIVYLKQHKIIETRKMLNYNKELIQGAFIDIGSDNISRTIEIIEENKKLDENRTEWRGTGINLPPSSGLDPTRVNFFDLQISNEERQAIEEWSRRNKERKRQEDEYRQQHR